MTTTTRAIRLGATTAVAAVAFALLAGFAPVPNANAAETIGTFRSRITPNATAATVTTTSDGTLAIAARTVVRTTTAVRKAARPVVTSSTSAGTSTTTAAPTSELAQAQSILNGYISRYPILAGTTVSFGDAKGYQAICYYQSGRIVISTTHTSSLERILGHEIWHVIDWRDNGVIDWGENVPPR